MSLNTNRNTAALAGVEFLVLGVASGKRIFAGALVCALAGLAVPGAEVQGLIAVGRAEGEADNTDGGDAAITVGVRKGAFLFNNSAGGDEITEADLFKTAYIVDDQTVAKTSGAGRSVAGKIVRIDESGGVFVEVGVPGQDRKLFLTVALASLKSADAKLYNVVSPVAGKVTAIRTAINEAVTGADGTLTGKINTVAITGGVVTQLLAGAAIGATAVATPTALNSVKAGDTIGLLVGGGNTATCDGVAVVEISY